MKFDEFCEPFSEVKDVVNIGRQYFHDPQHLYREGCSAVGIYLGEDRKVFKPSSALIDLLANEKKIVVSEEIAWLFLCGRDLMEGSVISGDYQKNEFVFVVDQDDNILGYGQVVDKGPIYVKNLLDRGEYLRREK